MRDTSLTKAFRVRSKERKYATLNDGQYVHFVVGRGKVCIGEEALFSFLREIKHHCEILGDIDGKYADLVVEEYAFAPVSTASAGYWDEQADALYAEKEKKRLEKEARDEEAFFKAFEGAPEPKQKTMAEIEANLKRPTKIRTV